MPDINTMLNAAYDAYDKVRAENQELRKRVATLEAMFKEAAAKKDKEEQPAKRIRKAKTDEVPKSS